jgi:hypothetical protein
MKHHIRFPRLITSLACLLLASSAFAAYPGFTSVKPNGAQRGTDVKLTMVGDRLSDFEGLIFMSEGLTLKSTDKVDNKAVEVTLGIAKDVQPGMHMFRIRTKSGISHFRPFYVGQFPNTEE